MLCSVVHEMYRTGCLIPRPTLTVCLEQCQWQATHDECELRFPVLVNDLFLKKKIQCFLVMRKFSMTIGFLKECVDMIHWSIYYQ